MRWIALVLAALPACSDRAEPLGELLSADATATQPEPAAAVEASPPPRAGARLRVLGTAQDGGLPHAACTCSACSVARRDPAMTRRVSSLAAITTTGDGSTQAFLIDATPDIHDQLHDLHIARGRPDGGVDRMPIDGILLTHAHVGHYLGLALLGFEAVDTRRTPVWASARMSEFLRANAPWDQLVRLENIELRPVAPAQEIVLAPGLRATPILVPHRDEYTDTLGFVLQGPTQRVLYVPDSSPWSAWPQPLPQFLVAHQIDIALLDGTFHAGDELPGRDLATLAHPLMVDTMDLLQPLVDANQLDVWFTHLNHSNAALDPHGPARAEILRRGFLVADDGLEIPL